MAVSGPNSGTGVTTPASSDGDWSLATMKGLFSVVVEDPHNRYFVVNDPPAMILPGRLEIKDKYGLNVQTSRSHARMLVDTFETA
jgi:hypothetical protein